MGNWALLKFLDLVTCLSLWTWLIFQVCGLSHLSQFVDLVDFLGFRTWSEFMDLDKFSLWQVN